MNKQTIKQKLNANHQLFVDFVVGLTDGDFLLSRNGKWTAGQQLQHICLAVRPVRQILGLPKILLKIIWGKANRQSRSYEELVEKYQGKLGAGGTASGRFVPKGVSLSHRQKLEVSALKEVDRLCAELDGFTEDDLDQYVLPHPLLGKLTVREMLYFTIYHVEHHMKLTEQNLSGKKYR
jgi:hypothetical protein